MLSFNAHNPVRFGSGSATGGQPANNAEEPIRKLLAIAGERIQQEKAWGLTYEIEPGLTLTVLKDKANNRFNIQLDNINNRPVISQQWQFDRNGRLLEGTPPAVMALMVLRQIEKPGIKVEPIRPN